MASQGLVVTVVGYPPVYPPKMGACQFDYVSVLESQPPGRKQRWLQWKQKFGPYWTHAIEPYLVKRAAFRYARKISADVVYVANVEPWLLFPIVWLDRFSRRRMPTVTMIPYVFQTTAGRPLSSQIRAWLNQKAAQLLPRYCDVICDNIHVARVMKIDHFPRTHLIPEGHTEFTSHQSQAEARKALGIPADKRMLLLFGVAGRAKGADLLFKAMEGLDPKFMLYVVGQTGGVYEASWGPTDQLKTSGWGDNLQVLPRFVSETEMEQFFTACDGVVLPYRHGYATTSGNLMMAIENGKALIAADQYYIGEMVRNNKLGLLFPPEDVAALRRCLQEFSEQPVTWFSEIRQNCQRVVEKLSWTNIGGLYRQLFERMVSAIDQR
jgi:glycosyltransferase involved in cell wall biosynthesis